MLPQRCDLDAGGDRAASERTATVSPNQADAAVRLINRGMVWYVAVHDLPFEGNGRDEREADMIIRWWRAVAGSEEVLRQYAEHLERTTFVEMAELPGHLGASLAVKVKGGDQELVVMSLWSDLASAGHFEKGAFDDAVVKPSTQKLLKSFDLKVEYFETVVATGKLADSP